MGWRAGLVAVGLLLAGLWWGPGSEILSTLLPVLSNWVGITLMTFVALVVLTALFPRSDVGHEGEPIIVLHPEIHMP